MSFRVIKKNRKKKIEGSEEKRTEDMNKEKGERDGQIHARKRQDRSGQVVGIRIVKA